MRSPRPSKTTTGNLTHLISNPTEDQPTSDAQPLTQDGGNSSDIGVPLLSTRKARSLKLSAKLMVKTKTLVSLLKAMKFTNNGILSMSMNGRENQSKEN